MSLTTQQLITEFKGDYRFLSNFFPSVIKYEEIKYKTVEHAFQAAKTLDPQLRKHCSKLPLPGHAKQWGRRLPRAALRPNWDTIRVDIMSELVTLKFRIPHLRKWLLATNDAHLVEGNTWGDTFWGECPLGNGRNELGKILMGTRSAIRAELEMENPESNSRGQGT